MSEIVFYMEMLRKARDIYFLINSISLSMSFLFEHIKSTFVLARRLTRYIELFQKRKFLFVPVLFSFIQFFVLNHRHQ